MEVHPNLRARSIHLQRLIDMEHDEQLGILEYHRQLPDEVNY